MRIIGEIDHKIYKICIFKSGPKTIIQIEDGLNEQLYKFRDGECVYDLESAIAYTDEKFLAGVESIFEKMKILKSETVKSIIEKSETDLPFII
jgi:hypothetical protein